jgi:hypothetical protein
LFSMLQTICVTATSDWFSVRVTNVSGAPAARRILRVARNRALGVKTAPGFYF